jgi:hypothetical protein
LFLLRFEGCTRGLSCLLQLKDGGVFLLTGLPQLFVGHDFLDQLAREPRDLQIPELEGSLCLLQHGALLLELALHFLPRHAFVLEGSSGLLEGGPLLLEPSFRLSACASLQLEQLLHRGK